MTLERNNSVGVLRRSAGLMTVGGALAAVYAAFLGTPVTADFYRSIGAKGYHFGLIMGIPMVMLSMHFVAALLSHRLTHRKRAFIGVRLIQRLLFLPIAFLPMIFPEVPGAQMMTIIVVILGVNAALTNTAGTLLNSWLADLIPHRILNRYWARRQRWMSITVVACYLLTAAFVHYVDWPVATKFALLVVGATIAGLIDVLLHIGADEPAHETVRDEHPWRLLTEPIRCENYRSFLLFQCVWLGSAVIAGAFMQIYALEELEIDVAHLTLIWTLQIVGSILAGRVWGRLADHHGHRPVLAICLTLKPTIALTFFLVTPETALWFLPPAMLLDGLLNAGLGVATNGYSMKMAPKRNRAMFLAATPGLSGMVMGVMALLAGLTLWLLTGWEFEFLGRTWLGYHVLFGLSVCLRILCNVWVRTIREPGSSQPIHVLRNLLPVRPWSWVRPPAVTDEDVVEDSFGNE